MAARSESPLHVLDLPQLHTMPSFQSLQDTLALLTLEPSNFESTDQEQPPPRVFPDGVSTYLVQIVSSSLKWIEDEEDRERIWSLASARLGERSGRTAMGDMTRHFALNDDPMSPKIALREPGLTGDYLGLKTWASSFVLARRIKQIDLPGLEKLYPWQQQPMILELGSGTGLLGLAAAATLQKHVVLTDLRAIQHNLRHNIELNANLLRELGGSAECATLDWQSPRYLDVESENVLREKAMVILVADPIYSPEHPPILVDTIVTWIEPSQQARIVIGYPIRVGYIEQIGELRRLMAEAGFALFEETVEPGKDDFADEVMCCCSVWGWNMQFG